MKSIYHSSFAIGTADKKPSLDEVLKVIDSWASRRTNSCLNFSQMGEETRTTFEDTSLDVLKLSKDGTSLVSLILKHDDREDKEFKWGTSVCLKDQANAPQKISITVSNGWSGMALRPDIDYKFSRPAIVPMLVDAFNCHNFKQLKNQPEILTRDNVKDLVDALYSKHRTLPIVLVTCDMNTERPIVNAAEIAKSIVGLAHVYVCQDKLVPFKIENSIGKSMSCYGGAVRIYWPINEKGTDPRFHPIITPQRLKEREGFRAKYLQIELLEKLAKESISRVAEVSPEEIQEMRLRLKAEVLTGQNDYQELAELYAQDNERLNKDNEMLKKSEADLQSKIQTLEAKIVGLQSTLENKQVKDEDEALTDTSFRTVKDAVKRVQEIYSEDQLVIMGRAQKGARECLYQHPEEVFKALEWLATTYRNTRKGELKGDLIQSCTNQTGLHYQPHQSKTTMGQFENEYYVEYNGGKIPLREHLRKGSSKDPRYSLSIAFFYDHAKEKVVVGFIGRHQTTKST